LREEIAPGDFVLPDQYIDRTRGVRAGTFFGGGVVAHAPFADPTCATLREFLAATATKLGIKLHRKGVYVCMEGPQFSTRAESHLYRSWELPGGPVSVIGMTALPEAKLAREAGLCYQTVAMATDYDCWNTDKGDVSIEEVIRVLTENVGTSRRLVKEALASSIPACSSHCRDLMKSAVITPKEHWPASKRAELEVILS
jgi:5'-methylthioadenosine phosphorylase